MSRIGFKQAHQQHTEEKHEPKNPLTQAFEIGVPDTFGKANLQAFLPADDAIKTKGALLAMETLAGYFDTAYMPLISGESRDEYFINKLRKIKELYFDSL